VWRQQLVELSHYLLKPSLIYRARSITTEHLALSVEKTISEAAFVDQHSIRIQVEPIAIGLSVTPLPVVYVSITIQHLAMTTEAIQRKILSNFFNLKR
jgi:uncharacterized membrane protein